MAYRFMRVFSLLFLVMALSIGVIAQEAKIIIVEKPDSQKLARAYREYKEAAKRWEDVKNDVAAQYTKESGKTMAGWERVQFSADFRALVPEHSQYSGSSNWGSGCITLTGNAIPASMIGFTPDGSAEVNADLVVKEKK